MKFRFHIILVSLFLFLGAGIYSQSTDPSFEDFKKSHLEKNSDLKVSSESKDPLFKDFKPNYLLSFRPVFQLSGPMTLIAKPLNLSYPSCKKPVFCRMEDNISDRYNFIFQLRAGSDEHYRSLAFPHRIEKRMKYVE